MIRNQAGQKITVQVIDASTGLPKSGDAVNITVYVSKDDGAVTLLTDITATEKDATNAKGLYDFDVSQSETNAEKLVFSGKSATANVAVIAETIYTRAANVSLLSIDASGRIDIGKIAGQTANAAAAVTFPAIVGNSTFAGGAVASVAGSVGSVTTPVTVGTNTDKTGYGLSLSERNSVALEVWSLSTAPTPALIAAAILVTTANKIATDATGRVNLNLTQAVPTTNTAETVGDALNAGRAEAFGKVAISSDGLTLTLYAADNVTAVKVFTLNSATNPTIRTPV